jgi:putative transposase
MKKGRFSEEQKIEAVRLMDGGRAAADIGRELGVSKHAIYAWKAKYTGMEVSEARRLKQLEDENRRLKVAVADLTLDRDILRAVIAKNGWSS